MHIEKEDYLKNSRDCIYFIKGKEKKISELEEKSYLVSKSMYKTEHD